ncbi:hypothetical protein [Shewanella sp. YLB-07]|uniref:hypothetical protein n=1 Tax=Shewanella sp. YLB-07 TaxID=2601268 RepID=UPI00128D1986|nr:hypothetical protein [Shewanella sp. YLB-07]MPY24440.1 hypothetical protein [Shewanella sp. YLB-07]
MYKVRILLILWVGMIIGAITSGSDEYDTDKYKEYNGVVLGSRCKKPLKRPMQLQLKLKLSNGGVEHFLVNTNCELGKGNDYLGKDAIVQTYNKKSFGLTINGEVVEGYKESIAITLNSPYRMIFVLLAIFMSMYIAICVIRVRRGARQG